MPMIVYYLINFAILVSALWLICRKLIKKTFSSRREKIAEDLVAAKEGQKAAQSIETVIAAKHSEAENTFSEIESSAKKHIDEHLAKSRTDFKAGEDLRRAAFEKELNNYRVTMLLDAQKQTVEKIEDALKNEKIVLPENFDEICVDKTVNMIKPGPGDAAYLLSHDSLNVKIYSAKPLADNLLLRIKNEINNKFGEILGDKQINYTVKTDGELLGGLHLCIGDTVYNTTVKRLIHFLIARTDYPLPSAGDSAKDISAAIKATLENLSLEPEIYQYGKVTSVSDGICRVSGISDAMYGELVDIDGGARGMVLDLDTAGVGCVLLEKSETVEQGCVVRRTGKIATVPVGDALLGRVVDALGKPIDGLGTICADEYRPIESAAPAILKRESVHTPLCTGIKAIDALVPIGRGQRELIIGDRQTGKTAIAIDTVLNQKDKNVVCIYVAIGQKESTVANVLKTLKDNDAMKNTVIVCADAYHAAPMQYVAPYAGTAMGEYFMNKGRDVLIIYDDLSKHAVAYRELSLLLHRPAGREAYPGDVFYLHSRLLERSACLNEEAGGGTMTALPIIETQAGDIAAYIPTNVISITDGQIFLESQLFHEGQRPAVNVGLSVSRVGGSAQTGPMKQVAGRLRMDLAQYRELAAFSQFGSDLDKATKDALSMGERMTAVLRQPINSPVSTEKQVLVLYAVAEGFAGEVEPEEMAKFERDLFEYFDYSYPQLLDEIAACGKSKMSPELCEKLKAAIAEFAGSRQ